MRAVRHVGRGYWHQASAAAALGIEAAQAAGTEQQQMNFELARMLVSKFTEDPVKSRRPANALMAMATRNKNALFANGSLMCLAALDLVESQPAGALAKLQALHAAALRIGDPLGRLNGMGRMARAYLMQGKRADARHSAEQALHVSR